MEKYFISKLKPLLDIIAEKMTLYVPSKAGEHYVFKNYDSSSDAEFELNDIRACTPVKEFLFPLRELVATFADSVETQSEEPFALFGLKDCDIVSIEILDKVFLEPDCIDPFYAKRRENMYIIATDCSDPQSSCFCNMFGGKTFCDHGFDLNVSKTEDGFIIEAGSDKGRKLLEEHKEIFTDVPDAAISQLESNRAEAQKQLEQNNEQYKFGADVNEIVENTQDSEVFDDQAGGCVECQACTRVCPTCHCFYLYDSNHEKYKDRMKMWDSCLRRDYTKVAGGANPRKILGDRLKHRFMHKFAYFLERYGVDMCVGCGRCIDADVGGIDIREVLKKLNQELSEKPKTKAAK